MHRGTPKPKTTEQADKGTTKNLPRNEQKKHKMLVILLTEEIPKQPPFGWC